MFVFTAAGSPLAVLGCSSPRTIALLLLSSSTLPLVEKLLDVWTLRSLGLRDGAALLQGSWGIAEASSENLQVVVALVAQLAVSCGGPG